MWSKIEHFRNMVATAEKSISLIFSALVDIDVKQITEYFVWLNIALFLRKSIITRCRQNAASGAQNFRRILKLCATKLKCLLDEK